MKVALIVPTLNAGDLWVSWLEAEKEQSFVCNYRLVIDSSSNDETVSLALDHGFAVHEIRRDDFNHGATRQLGVELVPDAEILIFLTQDAILATQDAIENILAYFSNESIGAVCGRQLPHHNATPVAAHARQFNYPSLSRIKSIKDVTELGIKTPFISNSFAAYRRQALLGVGGFPADVILAEDMFVAAKMLLNGWEVAYAGNASVRHSHNYSILEEFCRYFDTGVFHAREAWIRNNFGGSGGEGKRFVLSEFKYLGVKRFYLWPSSLIRNVFKLLGYRLGQQECYLPLWVKLKLSMNKRFWIKKSADLKGGDSTKAI